MRIRQLSIAAAVSLVAPLMAVISPGVLDAAADPAPVQTSDVQVALEAPAKTAGDGDVVTNRDLALAKVQAAESKLSAKAVAKPVVLEVSPEREVPADLTVMGVSWAAGTAADTVVQYRVRTSAGWQPWQAVDSDGGEEAVDGEPNARAGSDPVVVTGASHVQVRVLGAAGQDPADAKLTLIDPKTTSADARVGNVAPGSAAAAAAKPWINSRAAWGADESLRREKASYGRVKAAVVHHTAGTNNYSQAQVPAILRGIYAFHVKDRGWNDIGYNFLVDKWGRVWEGRAGGVEAAVVGAHATGTNSEAMGISVMGDYTKAAVSGAAVNALTRVIGWKADLHGFDPSGYTTLRGKRVPTVVGHTTVGQTSCPGGSIINQLPNIRRGASALTDGASPRVPAGVTNPAPKPVAPTGRVRGVPADNVLMRGSANALFASSPAGNNLTFARKISSGSFAGYNAAVAAGDLNRDGLGDVLARRASSAELFFFAGKADGTLANPVRVGSGWRQIRSMTAGANLAGDSVADLLAINNRGQLILYQGNGKGGVRSGRVIGSGWGNFPHVVSVGDWDGDRRGDLIGIRRDGKAFVYRGDGRGGLRSGAIALSGNFRNLTTVAGLVGRKAFAGVDSAGNGYVASRSGAKGTTTSKTTPSFRGLAVYGG